MTEISVRWGTWGEIADHLQQGLTAWAGTADRLVEGEDRTDDMVEILRDGAASGRVVPLILERDGEFVGYDLMYLDLGWLMGAQVWVDPDKRGGVFAAYAPQAARIAADLGLKGFAFVSTLPHWPAIAERAGMEHVPLGEQADGTSVTLYRLEAA